MVIYKKNTVQIHGFFIILVDLQNAAASLLLLPQFLVHKRSFGDLEFSHDPNELVKRFDDVNAEFGAALDVGNAHGAAELLRLVQWHLAMDTKKLIN